MAAVLWKLSQPSSGFLREPQLFQLGHKSWCLWWIAEMTEGGGRNEALVFGGVEALKRTEFLAYPHALIPDTYDTLVNLGETSFLSEVSANLRLRTSTAQILHLAISFDASPLYEFVARSFEVQAPFGISAIEANLKQRIASCVHPLSADRPV